MTKSSRDPDAYDRIREDALTEMVNITEMDDGQLDRLIENGYTESLDRIQALYLRSERQSARIATLEAQLAAATEREREHLYLLRSLEWIEGEYGPRTCYSCYQQERRGHTAECPVAAALAAAQQEGE